MSTSNRYCRMATIIVVGSSNSVLLKVFCIEFLMCMGSYEGPVDGTRIATEIFLDVVQKMNTRKIAFIN